MGKDIQSNHIFKMAKRIAITAICCLPFLILFGYFTRNVITSNALIIFINTVILLVAVLLEEFFFNRKEKKRKEDVLIEEHRDVFK